MKEYENRIFYFAIQEFFKDRLVRNIFCSYGKTRRQQWNDVQENDKYRECRQDRKLAIVYCLVYNTGLSWRPHFPKPTFLQAKLKALDKLSRSPFFTFSTENAKSFASRGINALSHFFMYKLSQNLLKKYFQ